MSRLTLRVATRYQQALRLAAFIPDKFFADYATRYKQLLKRPIKEPLEDIASLLEYEVIPLFQSFGKELLDLAPQAKESMDFRVGANVDMLQKIADSYRNMSRETLPEPYPARTVEDQVLRHIRVEVSGKLKKKMSTLAKALIWEPSIDGSQVRALARRAANKATPDEENAILEENWSQEASTLKFKFYEVNVDKQARALVKFGQIEKDFSRWFDFIRDVLAANYNEPLLHTTDLYGMKLVINDALISPKEHAKYIHYLDKAYQLLKRKKLSRAWYGNVFIECESCGGKVEGGRVQGHYYWGKDWVQIYDRPSEDIVATMIHELGHRYWWKSMTRGQRYRFEAYVRAHPREEGKDRGRVPSVLESKVLEAARKRIEDSRVEVWAAIGRMENADIERSTPASHFARRLENTSGFVLDMPGAARVVGDLDVPKSADPLFKPMIHAANKAGQHLNSFPELLKQTQQQSTDDATFAVAIARVLRDWCDEARELTDHAAMRATSFAVHVFTEYNAVEEAKKKERDEKRQKAWDADEREILPVSEYGKTNIDEAFAEAFRWYVLDLKMTPDQKGIFESVLLRQDRVAERVAQRYRTFQPWVTQSFV